MKLSLLLLAATAAVHGEQVLMTARLPTEEDVLDNDFETFRVLNKTEKARCGDLGYFSRAAPFFNWIHRPFSVVPNCKLIDYIDLHLNTRDNAHETQILNPYQPTGILQSKLNPSKPIKFLIHGFLDNYKSVNWVDMAKGLLDYEDCNVIRVDWSYGNRFPYYQATANTRLVGAYVAKLILVLQKELNVSLDQIHIIGHSLGAHTAGYAGKYVSDSSNGAQIGRITGLDPAGPFFTNMPEDVRLDPSDAKLVDTIISDGERIFNGDGTMAYGSPKSMGHINFRPNGGYNQPGCRKNMFQTMSDSTSNLANGLEFPSPAMLWRIITDFIVGIASSCNHGRAVSLFIESLNRTLPEMKAFNCESYARFLSGECSDCQAQGCTVVGPAANASLAENGKVKDLFFTTTRSSAFATLSYKITFSLTALKNEQHEGRLYVTLNGKNGTTGSRALTTGTVKMVPGETYSAFLDVKADIGEITSMTFMWKSKLDVNLFGVSSVKVIYVDSDIKLADRNGKMSILRLTKNEVAENAQVEAFSSA